MRENGVPALTGTLTLSWGVVDVRATGAVAVETVRTADATADGVDTGLVRVLDPTPGGTLELFWRIPCDDAAMFWSPSTAADTWLPMAVNDHRFVASAVKHAPLGALLAHDGTNRMSFGVSETVLPVEVDGGVDDMSLAADFTVRLRLTFPPGVRTPYVLELVTDARPVALSTSLRTVTDWYAARHQPALVPAPEAAQAPVYSTWYCFQQTVDAAAVEAEAARAREVGFGTLITDDGWQTADTGRDYAWCGDWQPEPAKFADMAAHVARVQELGLRYVLWIAPPLLGRRSAAWDRFSGRILGFHPQWQAGLLDPREPEVRRYLVEACLRPVRDWGVDGLKIDFIDALALFDAPPASPTADCALVAEGADRLLDAISGAVAAHRPDLLVEFRQGYVSPRLWRYGNLLRAFDCPYDSVANRVRTLKVRLLAGPHTAHADPITWHPDTAPEAAARHLLAAAFSVPQISVRLDALSPAHRDVVGHWLRVFRRWQEVLLTGELVCGRPELNHPYVWARRDGRLVLASYADIVVPVPTDGAPPAEIAVLNGGTAPRVLLDLPGPLGSYTLTVHDCRGRLVHTGRLDLTAGLHVLAVPTSGTAHLTRC